MEFILAFMIPFAMRSYLDGKSMKMLFENQIKVLEGQRVHCFFYTAEKDRGNGPVGFRLVIEEVPELLKLPGVQ